MHCHILKLFPTLKVHQPAVDGPAADRAARAGQSVGIWKLLILALTTPGSDRNDDDDNDDDDNDDDDDDDPPKT